MDGALVFVFEKWGEGRFTVIVTTDVISEYFAVLNRSKFGLKQATIDTIAHYIYQFSEFVVPEEQIRLVEEDPNYLSRNLTRLGASYAAPSALRAPPPNTTIRSIKKFEKFGCRICGRPGGG